MDQSTHFLNLQTSQQHKELHILDGLVLVLLLTELEETFLLADDQWDLALLHHLNNSLHSEFAFLDGEEEPKVNTLVELDLLLLRMQSTEEVQHGFQSFLGFQEAVEGFAVAIALECQFKVHRETFQQVFSLVGQFQAQVGLNGGLQGIVVLVEIERLHKIFERFEGKGRADVLDLADLSDHHLNIIFLLWDVNIAQLDQLRLVHFQGFGQAGQFLLNLGIVQ